MSQLASSISSRSLSSFSRVRPSLATISYPSCKFLAMSRCFAGASETIVFDRSNTLILPPSIFFWPDWPNCAGPTCLVRPHQHNNVPRLYLRVCSVHLFRPFVTAVWTLFREPETRREEGTRRILLRFSIAANARSCVHFEPKAAFTREQFSYLNAKKVMLALPDAVRVHRFGSVQEIRELKSLVYRASITPAIT